MELQIPADDTKTPQITRSPEQQYKPSTFLTTRRKSTQCKTDALQNSIRQYRRENAFQKTTIAALKVVVGYHSFLIPQPDDSCNDTHQQQSTYETHLIPPSNEPAPYNEKNLIHKCKDRPLFLGAKFSFFIYNFLNVYPVRRVNSRVIANA